MPRCTYFLNTIYTLKEVASFPGFLHVHAFSIINHHVYSVRNMDKRENVGWLAGPDYEEQRIFSLNWIGKIIGNILLSKKGGDRVPISWQYTVTGTNLPMRSKLEEIFSPSGGSTNAKTHFMGAAPSLSVVSVSYNRVVGEKHSGKENSEVWCSHVLKKRKAP